MTKNKRFKVYKVIGCFHEWSVEDTVDDKVVFDNIMFKYSADKVCNKLNELNDVNEQLKQELERCKDWINSDKNDYELTLSFIKNKGYSLKDILEYEKELKSE